MAFSSNLDVMMKGFRVWKYICLATLQVLETCRIHHSKPERWSNIIIIVI